MASPSESQPVAGTAFDPTAVIVFGGGGQGKVSIELVQATGAYQAVGVVDDFLQPGSRVMGVPVLGGAGALGRIYEDGVRQAVNAVGGIGNVDARIKIFELLLKAGFLCPTFVHPTAFVEPSAILQGGIQILAKTYISSDARLGFGCLLNAGVVVSHDCQLGKVVNLSPGALLAGSVIVEDYAQIGMGATVNIGVHIGRRARIGNGATIKADVPADGRVWAGVTWPLRQLAQS